MGDQEYESDGSSSSMSDFEDDPYSSPEQSSENDEAYDDLDFSEFSQPTETDDIPNSESSVLKLKDTFCECGNCVDSNAKEAVCCTSRDELQELITQPHHCITETYLFEGLLSQGLEYTRFIHASSIKDPKKRNNYLNTPLTDSLKRHLLYRNFVIMANRGHPLGKNNRVVIPSCVVSKIRDKYPEEDNSYHGFHDVTSQD